MRMTFEEHDFLLEVAMGRKVPTLLIRGGQVLNVFTGRLEQAEVALAGRRIAYVGKLEQSGLKLDEEVPVLNAAGQVMVPGYIEPHAHPFQLYNPITLAEKVGALGTTTLICDNLNFFVQLDAQEMIALMENLSDLGVSLFWWARFDAQTHLSEKQMTLFSPERVREVLLHERVVQAGELTDWLPLLAGDATMKQWVVDAKNAGKRVEGHLPGASYRTLSRLAAAGVTGDHESITSEEVWRRLELGYMVTLRHSSIRPDLPVLLEGLLREGQVPWHRLMMTTDGATPLYLKNGFVDHLIEVAIACGCSPIHAYQMVTINPANYYHMEEHLGSIAPGRLANINLLASLEEPRPLTVIVEGRKLAEGGKLCAPLAADPQIFAGMDWGKPMNLTAEDFRLAVGESRQFPVMHMVNSVITKKAMEEVRVVDGLVCLEPGDERIFAFLVDRHGEWVTPGLVRGFGQGIDGLASSYTGSQDLLVLGRDSEAMAQAANFVVEMGGGIAWIQGGECAFALPLPILGAMSVEPVDALIAKLEPFVEKLREHGFTHLDPLYTLMFLSSTHLPQIRLTKRGLMLVKEKKILIPAKARA